MGNAQAGGEARQASQAAFDRVEEGRAFQPYSDEPRGSGWFSSTENMIRRSLGGDAPPPAPPPPAPGVGGALASSVSNLVRKVSGTSDPNVPTKSVSKEGAWASMPFGTGGIVEQATTTTENPCPCMELSYQQRMVGFVVFFVLGTICSCMSTMYVPMVVIKPAKFAIPYTLGNLLSMGSTGFLVGLKRQCKSMFDGTRMAASSVFFASMFGTLYFAFIMKSGIGTMICVVVQLLAYAWYIASYIPFGRAMLQKCACGIVGCCCRR
jgi:hypothetical protein